MNFSHMSDIFPDIVKVHGKILGSEQGRNSRVSTHPNLGYSELVTTVQGCREFDPYLPLFS